LRAVRHGIAKGLAETLHQAPGDGHRGLDRDLLADDGADRLLERVEGGGQAQAEGQASSKGAGAGRRPGARRWSWLGVEVEHPPHPLYQRRRVPPRRREVQLQAQGRLVGLRANVDPAGGFAEAHAAPVDLLAQAFDAGQAARASARGTAASPTGAGRERLVGEVIAPWGGRYALAAGLSSRC
jgi:hypothetical protein